MASPQSNALKQWAQIIKQWPVDKVRPASVSFQHVMQQRIQRSTDPTSLPPPNKKTGEPPKARLWNERKELQEAHILSALLSNSFAKSYPLAEKIRYPASSPTHYDDLVRELEEAPSRSWFSGLVKRIKGSFRLS